MTDDFNYEAPHAIPDPGSAEAQHARWEAQKLDRVFEQHVVTAGETSIPVKVEIWRSVAHKYRHQKTGQICDVLEGLGDDDGIQSVETDEVEWEAWIADAYVDWPWDHGYDGNGHHYRFTRYDRQVNDRELAGTRQDAINDLLARVRDDLVDPPNNKIIHLDHELLKELNEQAGEAAKKGLRCTVLAVDFGNNDLKPVVITELVPYASRRDPVLIQEAVKAELYHITNPGHRFRHAEVFASGSGQSPHMAILRLLHRYAEELQRHFPTAHHAMPAGAEIDLLCAQARQRWSVGCREPFYVETSIRDGVCWVREKWYLDEKPFRPSTDWNDAMALFEALGSTMWGSACLDFDGDCFNPPPWRFTHSGGFAVMTGGVGVGDTGQLAICRAFIDAHQETGGFTRWDLNDDNVYDPWGDWAREKAERQASWEKESIGVSAEEEIAKVRAIQEQEAAKAEEPHHDPTLDMRRGDPNGDLS